VKQSIHPFVNDLGLSQLMDNLANYKSEISADHCQKTLDLVVDNAVDTVNNKIIDLLQTVVNKVSGENVFIEFLLEHARKYSKPVLSLDVARNEQVFDRGRRGDQQEHHSSRQPNAIPGRKPVHVEQRAERGEFPTHTRHHRRSDSDHSDQPDPEQSGGEFDHARVYYIPTIIVFLPSPLPLPPPPAQKKKPPSYFRNLRDSFIVLFGFLRKGNETECTSDTIKKLEGLLHLHALDTVDLIHEYYLERLRDQTELQDAAEGVLTVKLIFINDVLKVDVLNANNIKAMDSNGTVIRSRRVAR